MRNKLLYFAFLATIFLALLHYTATLLILYLTVSWFDNVVHFMGGFTIGLFGLWLTFVSGIFPKIYPERKKIIITSVVIVLAIGIGWEIFEFINGLTQSTESYPLDVLHDLISDIMGAIIAGDIASRKSFYVTE